MKKVVKCISVILFVCLFLCSGCKASVFYEKAEAVGEINVIEIYYNKYTKKAFASSYFWDGDESNMEFTVPDTYNGYKVTMLGGYYGSGAICPFGVILPKLFRDKELVTYYNYLPSESKDKITETLTFKINVGKNVKELKRIYYGYDAYGDRETNTVERIYVINYYYICSEENETYYSKDGVLYLKSNDEKAQFEVGGGQ